MSKMDLQKQREENIYRKKELLDNIQQAFKRYKQKRNKYNLNQVEQALEIYWNEFVNYDIELLTEYWEFIIKLPKNSVGWFSEKINHYDLRQNLWELMPDFIKKEIKVHPLKSLLLYPQNANLQRLVSPFAMYDALRPVFSGTYFGENEVVTTDAHVLLYLYKKNLLKENKIEEGTYCLTKQCLENYPQMKGNKLSLEDRDLNSSKFPNYSAIIPSVSKDMIVFNTQELYDVLMTINKSRLLNPITNQINLKYNNNEFGLNANFFLSALKTALMLGWKETIIDTNDGTPNRPKILSEAGTIWLNDVGDYAYSKTNFILLMPVMIDMGTVPSFFTYHIDLTHGTFVSAKLPIKLFNVRELKKPKVEKKKIFNIKNINELQHHNPYLHAKLKKEQKESQNTIRVKWGQKESTDEWQTKEYGSYEDSGNSPSHVVGILEREYSKKKPYLEITIDEANTIKESAEYQSGAWEQDEINPDNENPPLRYYNTVMKGYVDRINKELNKAKDTPSKANDETEKIGGRKRKKLREHKKIIKEKREKEVNNLEVYELKIDLYTDLLELPNLSKEERKEYKLKIELYQDLVDLESEEEWTQTIVDEDTGEVTEIKKKVKK